MSKKKKAGRTEGFAVLELLEGLSHMDIRADVMHSENKINDPTLKVDDPNAVKIKSFEYEALPGQLYRLALHYPSLAETYWRADIQILNDIQDELKIRYPDSHPDMPLKVIKIEDINPKDYYDFFFTQFKLEKLGIHKAMRGGIYTFDCSDPIDRLLFYNYMYHPDCQVIGQDVDKYSSGRKRWKLTLPEKEKETQILESNINTDAIAVLHPKRGVGIDRLRLIVEILNIRVDKDANDDTIRLALKTQVANSTKDLPAWNMSSQAVLVYLAEEVSNTELTRIATLNKAMNYNLIIKTADTYRFNEELIPGVTKDGELYEHFGKKANLNKLREIEDFVASRDTKINGNKQ